VDMERTLTLKTVLCGKSSSAGRRGTLVGTIPILVRHRVSCCTALVLQLLGMAGSLSDAHGDAEAVCEIHYQINVKRTYVFPMVRDSSVGTATRYGMDGPGTILSGGRDFPHPSRPAPGPTQPPI
jgi:hypothetical protein